MAISVAGTKSGPVTWLCHERLDESLSRAVRIPSESRDERPRVCRHLIGQPLYGRRRATIRDRELPGADADIVTKCRTLARAGWLLLSRRTTTSTRRCCAKLDSG